MVKEKEDIDCEKKNTCFRVFVFLSFFVFVLGTSLLFSPA